MDLVHGNCKLILYLCFFVTFRIIRGEQSSSQSVQSVKKVSSTSNVTVTPTPTQKVDEENNNEERKNEVGKDGLQPTNNAAPRIRKPTAPRRGDTSRPTVTGGGNKDALDLDNVEIAEQEPPKQQLIATGTVKEKSQTLRGAIPLGPMAVGGPRKPSVAPQVAREEEEEEKPVERVNHTG